MDATVSVLRAIRDDFRSSWRTLLLTDLAYKIVAFLLLTPIVSFLFQAFVAISGRSILADFDIVYFFVSPIGWICMAVVGTVWLVIFSLELAALTAIIAARRESPIGTRDALGFATVNAWPVFKVAAMVVCYTLAAVAPLVVAAGAAYAMLLTSHDINFYLAEKPPAWWIAIGLGAAIAAVIVAVVLRLVAKWFFALPVLLFDKVPATRALKVSRERTHGRRRILVLWILGWLVFNSVLSTAVFAIVVGVGRLIVPLTSESLVLMTIAIGGVLSASTAALLLANLISTSLLAAMVIELYWHYSDQIRKLPATLSATKANSAAAGIQLTRGRLVIGTLAGLAIAAFIGESALDDVKLTDDVEIIAHRAGAAVAPENTLAAARQAIADGADWIEIDVQETKDGEVVVLHDRDFMRLARSNLKIWETSAADLKKLDIGLWFSPEFINERVATLRDMLELCKGKVGVNIELKHYGHATRLEERVIEIVESTGMERHIVIMSLDSASVRKMKSLRPNWKVGLLTGVAIGNLSKQTADFFAVSMKIAERKFIRSTHKHDKQVQVWTVNDPATMSVMIGRGVNGLITDEPATARTVLAERGEMGVVQRLLVEFADDLGVDPELGSQ
jgi:glycerophosphoryl diester phosphodiesterase